MSINYRLLQEELTKEITIFEYIHQNPMTSDMDKKAFNAYRNDNRFYNKINYMVAGIINTVRKHEE